MADGIVSTIIYKYSTLDGLVDTAADKSSSILALYPNILATLYYPLILIKLFPLPTGASITVLEAGNSLAYGTDVKTLLDCDGTIANSCEYVLFDDDA